MYIILFKKLFENLFRSDQPQNVHGFQEILLCKYNLLMYSISVFTMYKIVNLFTKIMKFLFINMFMFICLTVE